MYRVILDPRFRADYRAVRRENPGIASELSAAIDELTQTGTLPEEYRPHELTNPGGNYNGHQEFHLSEGKVDVIVLYIVHKNQTLIRLVRMGTHGALFQGPML